MNYLGYFLKLKFYLGTRTALRVFYHKCIRKEDICVPFITHPFKIRYHDFADNQIFNYVILRRCYMGIADKNEVSRIMDLGAHIGLSAISFLSEYLNAEVLVVEPDPGNYKLLVENTSSYNSSKVRVYHYNTAIYADETEMLLHDPQTGTHGFQILEKNSYDQGRVVKAVTINNLLDRHGWDQVDIIKINIEGAEKELFERNTEWIARTKCLIVETHDRFKDGASKSVFRALEKFPYKMRILEQNLIFTLF
ncbi:MAG: FkbM family methyltransferase [Cyclobacteriaceae bacterium]|nr:FkbM family methyltransferase [Cyclobacteriaceae bacterium]